MVRSGAITARGAVRRAIRIRRSEGHELALYLHAAIRVGVDDHAQRAVEDVALLRDEVVQLLQREGFVALQKGVPVALELGDTAGPALALL
jgi:hypothetical protein